MTDSKRSSTSRLLVQTGQTDATTVDDLDVDPMAILDDLDAGRADR